MEHHPVVKKVLITKTEIIAKTQELAIHINEYYKDINSTPILIGILKGCVPFLAELINHITIDCEIDFMAISSFQGSTEAITEPFITIDINQDIKNRDILIVEDIIESGYSLVKIQQRLLSLGAKSVKIITLLDKIEGRKVAINPDWFGFIVPNHFLVGYGLDYNEKLRNLPYIAIADIEKLHLLK